MAGDHRSQRTKEYNKNNSYYNWLIWLKIQWKCGSAIYIELISDKL